MKQCKGQYYDDGKYCAAGAVLHEKIWLGWGLDSSYPKQGTGINISWGHFENNTRPK